jgi:kynurenine formamidase
MKLQTIRLNTTIQGTFYWIDQTAAVSIAIRQSFDESQPNLYGVPAASAQAVEWGEFVGDTSRGGSCNFDALQLIPHCHGTHTESVAHIVNDKVPVVDQIESFALLAALITVEPVPLRETQDAYPGGSDDDRVITQASIEKALRALGTNHVDAIVIRTLPNEATKCAATYDTEPAPPFLTTQAIATINERDIKHLLVDLPSIDRIFDEGRLANHHAFWNVEPGSRQLSADSRRDKTITEFIFVPDEVSDGVFVLNLQVADFRLDAVPSRPVLIPLSSAPTDS